MIFTFRGSFQAVLPFFRWSEGAGLSEVRHPITSIILWSELLVAIRRTQDTTIVLASDALQWALEHPAKFDCLV